MENHGSGYAKPDEHFDYLDPPDVLRGGGVRLMACFLRLADLATSARL